MKNTRDESLGAVHTHTHTGYLLNKKRAILLNNNINLNFTINNKLYDKNNNKIYLNKSAGITIISLIVTIIVLLILAGISITTLTSDNGIISQSKSAKENTEISEEKEIIQKAVIGAIGENKRGNLTYDNLENQLNKSTAETTVDDIGEEFEIIFKKSNRSYTVDKNGDIIDEQQLEKIENPGDITKNNQCDGSEEKPYEISCIEDLVAFSNMAYGSGVILKDGKAESITKRTGFSDKYIILTRNLNFNSKNSYADSTRTDFGDLNTDGTVEPIKEELTKTDDGCIGFTPIAINYANFNCHFDGKNNAIKNIYIHRKDGQIGLFNNIDDIKNLTLTGNIINDTWEAGGIVCNSKKVENCTNYANVTAYNYVGGISAHSKGYIKNCTNYGTIVVTGSSWISGGAGGMASDINQAVNCVNYGEIKGTDSFIGGIAGTPMSAGDKLIDFCQNYGKVTYTKNASGKSCGGIMGNYSGGKIEEIRNCTNYGEISGWWVGGIIGGMLGYNWESKLDLNITNCNNLGNVLSENNICGGILGIQGTLCAENYVTIKNCYNIGRTKGVTSGSIIGKIEYEKRTDSKTVVENVYYSEEPAMKIGTLTSGKFIYKSQNEIKSKSFCDLLNTNISDEQKYKKWSLGKNNYPEISF